MSRPGPLFAPSDGSVWCNLSSRRGSKYALPRSGARNVRAVPRGGRKVIVAAELFPDHPGVSPVIGAGWQ